MLPKAHLLEVAGLDPAFASLIPILHGATDKQNVPCAQAIFCNPRFAAAVGYPEVAIALMVFGRAYEANDQRSLSGSERTCRLHDRALLCERLLRPVLSACEPLPQSVRGISTRILMAVWGNSDTRLHYLRHATQQQQQQFCKREVATDTLEKSLSQMFMQIGHKGTPRQVKPHLQRLDCTYTILDMGSARGFFQATSKGKGYAGHGTFQAQPWNEVVSPGKLAALEERKRIKYMKVADKKADGKVMSARRYHDK